MSERIRESLWFWPLFAALVSVVLATALARVGPLDGSVVDRFLVSLSPSGAQSLLATLLSAMVAATSIVSSLTIVVLQTASTQFSPRLLRDFLRDESTQAVLSLFVGTSGFLVTLIVEADATTARLAITVALGLVLASVVVIVWFFNHISQKLRVESIMRNSADEAAATVDRLGRWLATGRPNAGLDPRVPVRASTVRATRSGYIQQFDTTELAAVARENGIEVRLAHQLGQPVTEGAPLAWWWSTATPSTTPADDLAPRIGGCVAIGFERTARHDVALEIRQLVDMSIKAMSPAVNDPYTAMQAVDHLGEILVQLRDIPLGDHVWGDDDAHVVVPVATYAELATLACDQLGRYGNREPAVMQRLMTMLCDVASSAGPHRRTVLRSLVVRCGDNARAGLDDTTDRPIVEAIYDEVLRWFDDGVPLSAASRGNL